MIDHDGVEWLTYADAARAVRVRVGTLKVWVHRGKIAVHRTGRNVWLHMGDVRRAETAWTRRMQDKAGVTL